MRNLKRVFSLALALVMVLGMMVITSSAATFTDADEITNKEAVEVLNTLGIVNGMGDGTFAPNGTFTREQAAKMITYMKLGPKMAEKLAGTDVFADVAASRWSAKYIGYCANLGIIAGVGGGNFNPAGELTDIALGKMVLVALGYDASKYVGENWATAVTIDMLDAGLVANVTGTAISREDACALILEGMKKGSATVTYDVVVGEKTVKFDNQNDALLYCAIADGAVFEGKTVVIENSLLEDVYGVVYAPVDNDDFGRPAATYTIGKTKLVYAEEATFTYEGYIGSTAGQKQVAADLTEAGVKLTQDAKYQNTYHFAEVYPVIDGVVADKAVGSNYDLTGLSKSKDGVVIEVFVSNKVVTDIVVIETHAAIVEKFTEATKTADAYITVEGIDYETEDFAAGDVVLYTKAKGEIVEIEKAPAFTGVLTAYNTDNELTIDGEVYTISYGSAEAFKALLPEIQGQLGKNYVYHLGVNGEIVSANPVKGAKPVVITDYAYVLATDVDYTEEDTFASFGDNKTTEVTAVTARVKVVLSDGTYGIYNLAVEENKGVFTVEINGADVELYGETVTTEAAADAALAASVAKIYTYTAAENVLALVKDVTPAAATDKIVKSSLSVDGALINNDTVVVLGKLNAKKVIDSWYTTTVSALESTEIAGALVFTAPVKNDKDEKIADVATVIFAIDTAFVATQAAEELDVDAIVYVDGSYSTSIGVDKNGNPVNVYTYTGVKADGSEVDVVGAKGLKAGVYMVNGKGEAVALDETVAKATQDQVTAIVGTTYQLKSGNVVTIKAEVEPVALSSYVEMEVGADICYITNAKGAIVAVYVLDL